MSEADVDDESSWDDDEVGARQRVVEALVLPADRAGQRLDRALADLLPAYSRSRLQQWLRSGEILVDGRSVAPRTRVLGGERVCVDAAPCMAEDWSAEPMPLRVVHDDDMLIVIDKPAGLVVHPGAGNLRGTLVNGLLYRYPELAAVPRAGIVHRLDKDTSGLLVVARNDVAHAHLARQLADRSMGRTYLALAEGLPTGDFRVDAAIGRDPRNRMRMAVTASGREAVTHVTVMERFRAHSLLRCRLETGRTHQIRVHLRHRDLPLVGDRLYGARGRIPIGAGPELAAALRAFHRQALHAARLTLIHPGDGSERSFDAPLADDMARLLELLRGDAAK